MRGGAAPKESVNMWYAASRKKIAPTTIMDLETVVSFFALLRRSCTS